MTNMQILDCTLRDGGYINNFDFGEKGIKEIINQLTNAGIDIIETGFLQDEEYSINRSIYNTVEQIKHFLPADHKKSMYVAMACYGEYSLEQLSDYDGTSIDGIRVTFHYPEVEPALEYCKQIMDKGYKVFVQPVGTSSYSDEKLLTLIKKVNELHPYSFYLVDTLGLMDKDELLRFYYIINHNLASTIHMGFHSHNNLQLSFSNSQALLSVEGDRVMSLDSSVYGMGRGAGNLNTELIANYLNEHANKCYDLDPLLEIVDDYISKIKEKYEWGYAVPYYLAATNGCHPNYAIYLCSKNTLNVKSISTILHMIEPNKRSLFDKNLAEQKYIEFQSREIDDKKTIDLLKSKFVGRNILILAPGSSLSKNEEYIKKTASDNNCLIVSISFVPGFIKPDFVFMSNKKRYLTLGDDQYNNETLIHTSNINIEGDNLVVNYSDVINEDDNITDNSSLMMLNLLCKLQPSKIYIAGMDGYIVGQDNYYNSKIAIKHDIEQTVVLNKSISRRLVQLESQLNIEMITPSVYK